MGLTKEQALALAAARKRQAEMGFPQEPGGVSVDKQAASEFKQKAKSLAAGVISGMSFGLDDEAAGVMSYLSGDGYAKGRDQIRAIDAWYQRNEPNTFVGGQIGGAMVPAIAAAPLGAAPTVMGQTARGAGIGLLEGALHGFGASNGVDAGKNAIRSGLLGAGLGAAFPAAIGATRAFTRTGMGALDAALDRASQSRAGRQIADTFRRSGKTPQQVSAELAAARAAGQPDYRVVDALGVTGQRQLSGVVRGGGDPAQEITNFLEARQAGQSERVASYVEDAFGFKGDPAMTQVIDQFGGVLARPNVSAAAAEAALKKARKDAADIAYKAARGNAKPVVVDDVLDIIDTRLGPLDGNEFAEDTIDGIFKKYRDRLVQTQSDETVMQSDFGRILGIKQDLQDEIGRLTRAGSANAVRQLKPLESALDAALEASSDGYRAANDNFRRASTVIDSIAEGAAMSRPGSRAVDTTAQFAGMTPEQQAAARLGYGDRLLQQIEGNSSPTSNKAKPLQSPKRELESGAMALKPEVYAERLARENAMWSTQNRALGGSRTADNLADIQAANQGAEGLLGAARSAANFQVGDALAKVGTMTMNAARGMNEPTRGLLAQALMSDNPTAAISRAIAQAQRASAVDAFIAAALRSATSKSRTTGNN